MDGQTDRQMEGWIAKIIDNMICKLPFKVLANKVKYPPLEQPAGQWNYNESNSTINWKK